MILIDSSCPQCMDLNRYKTIGINWKTNTKNKKKVAKSKRKDKTKRKETLWCSLLAFLISNVNFFDKMKEKRTETKKEIKKKSETNGVEIKGFSFSFFPFSLIH